MKTRSFGGTKLADETAIDKDLRSAQYPSARFQHAHYAVLADILKRGDFGKPMAEYFADEMARHNPKFSRKRFLIACGFAS